MIKLYPSIERNKRPLEFIYNFFFCSFDVKRFFPASKLLIFYLPDVLIVLRAGCGSGSFRANYARCDANSEKGKCLICL